MERNGESCVQKAATGDPAAFGLLVEEHTPWLLVRLTRRLGSQEVAEDVLQEAFIAAYQQLAELRSPERFGAWLCSIADNKARMWQRCRLTQLNLLDQLNIAAPPEQEKQEIRALVRKAIGRLSDSHRDVIVHHYLKGYSYQQTATLLHLQTGVVKSRLQKARKRLQKEIMAMAESSTAQTFELGPADLAGLRHVTRFISDDPKRPIMHCICLDAGGRIVATDGSRLLNWSSRGLASLPAPVILDSLQAEMVPETDSATLIIEEESATLRTPDGFSQSGEKADDLHGDNLPDWEHSVSCPAEVTNIEDGGSFRAGLNHDFLTTIVEALKDGGEEIRIYLAHSEAPLHFEAGEDHHAAVLMPMRMAS